MKRFLVSASVVAMLVAGLATRPVNAADDEVKGAVPTRSDANNPNTEVYRASDVMNMPVKNDDGAEVGRIKDLVINGESREVLYAVVSMNDAKEKDALYIMPWTVFQPNYGQGNALQYTVLTLPQSVWIQAPFYSASQWRTVSYSQWAPRVNTYYSSHIREGGSGSTKVKASKPAINNDDVDSSPKSKTDRTDKKNDSDKKGDSDKKSDTDKKSDSDKKADTDKKSDTDKKTDKPAPKADSDRNPPAPKTAPNPNPNPAPKATDKPDAPKAPATNPPAPGAPKTLPAPSPRDPKVPAPK